MLITKLLYSQEERDEFDRVLKETYLQKINFTIVTPLSDLDYFAVIDDGKIIAGCKLAYSKGVKYSNSATGHKTFSEKLDEKFNLNLNLKDFVGENDTYVEINRLFSTISKDAVTVLVTDLCELFYEQGVDYAIALVKDPMIKIIQHNFGIIDETKENKLILAEYGEYNLIKISHKLINMWKELGYKHSPFPSRIIFEENKED